MNTAANGNRSTTIVLLFVYVYVICVLCEDEQRREGRGPESKATAICSPVVYIKFCVHICI